MAGISRDSFPRPAGVPRSWDRRYRRWARRAVQRRSADWTSPPDPASDGIHEAALLAVLVATLSGVAGLVAALLFNLGLGAGLVGLAACSALCWRWMVRAMAFLEGD
jgi:hypothetical protein